MHMEEENENRKYCYGFGNLPNPPSTYRSYLQPRSLPFIPQFGGIPLRFHSIRALIGYIWSVCISPSMHYLISQVYGTKHGAWWSWTADSASHMVWCGTAQRELVSEEGTGVTFRVRVWGEGLGRSWEFPHKWWHFPKAASWTRPHRIWTNEEARTSWYGESSEWEEEEEGRRARDKRKESDVLQGERSSKLILFRKACLAMSRRLRDGRKSDILSRKKLRQRRVSHISSTLERTCLLGLDTSVSRLNVLSHHITTAHLPHPFLPIL